MITRIDKKQLLIVAGGAQFEQITGQMNEAIKECIKFMDDDNPN